MTTRPATEEEAAAIFTAPAGTDLWVCLTLSMEGEPNGGHLCLTRSPFGVFGHNTEFDSPEQALALWRAARRQIKAWGFAEYFVHLEIGTDKRLRDFWMRHAKPAFVTLRGEL